VTARLLCRSLRRGRGRREAGQEGFPRILRLPLRPQPHKAGTVSTPTTPVAAGAGRSRSGCLLPKGTTPSLLPPRARISSERYGEVARPSSPRPLRVTVNGPPPQGWAEQLSSPARSAREGGGGRPYSRRLAWQEAAPSAPHPPSQHPPFAGPTCCGAAPGRDAAVREAVGRPGGAEGAASSLLRSGAVAAIKGRGRGGAALRYWGGRPAGECGREERRHLAGAAPPSAAGGF